MDRTIETSKYCIKIKNHSEEQYDFNVAGM